MEAAHKVDSDFGVKKPSGKHTIRDSSGDIKRMTHHLLEKKVSSPQDDHTSLPCFLGARNNPKRWKFSLLCKHRKESELYICLI